jgi:hypothetical protein
LRYYTDNNRPAKAGRLPLNRNVLLFRERYTRKG